MFVEKLPKCSKVAKHCPKTKIKTVYPSGEVLEKFQENSKKMAKLSRTSFFMFFPQFCQKNHHIKKKIKLIFKL
jgi:hypothetical protein